MRFPHVIAVTLYLEATWGSGRALLVPLREQAARLGLFCDVALVPHLFGGEYHITLTGAPDRLGALSDWLDGIGGPWPGVSAADRRYVRFAQQAVEMEARMQRIERGLAALREHRAARAETAADREPLVSVAGP